MIGTDDQLNRLLVLPYIFKVSAQQNKNNYIFFVNAKNI